MTGTDIDTKARLLLNDEDAIRWVTANMLSKINDALRVLYTVRSSAFNLTGVTIAFPGELTAIGSTVPVQDSYRQALVHYVCYLCFLGDSEDSSNAKLAQTHYDLFEKELG